MSQDAVEDGIRAYIASRDPRSATTVLIEAYGPEIYGFLRSRLHEEDAADEVFAMWAEDVWTGLPRFEWRCTVRAWAYVLARNAEHRFRAAPHRRRAFNVGLSHASEALVVIDRVRTSTKQHLRSEVKSQVRALREQLSEEEQTILVLRVDKRLSWNDIASVMAGGDISDEHRARETAKLRKRFQLVREKLKKLVDAEGMLLAE